MGDASLSAEQVEALAEHEPVLGMFGGVPGIVGCTCLSARDYRAADFRAGQAGWRDHLARTAVAAMLSAAEREGEQRGKAATVTRDEKRDLAAVFSYEAGFEDGRAEVAAAVESREWAQRFLAEWSRPYFGDHPRDAVGYIERAARAALAVSPATDAPATHDAAVKAEAWVDKHGDTWHLGDDGLLHTPETAPFPREHVEKKWGPLRPAHHVNQRADRIAGGDER